MLPWTSPGQHSPRAQAGLHAVSSADPGLGGLSEPPVDPDAQQLIGFDIETDTSRGGLDPERAAIVAIAVCTRSCDHVFTGAEADILRRTDELLARLGAGLLVTWNGASFDLPFVARRADILCVELGLDVTHDPDRRSNREPDRRSVRGSWYELVHLDGYLLYRADVGRSLGISCGLKALARLVGMQPVELDRTALHLASEEDVTAYVASDARVAAELVRRRMPAARCDRGSTAAGSSPSRHLHLSQQPPPEPRRARS